MLTCILYLFAPFVALQLDEVEIQVEADVAEGARPIEEEAPPEDPPMEVPVVQTPTETPPIIEARVDRDLAGALNQRARVSDVHRGFGIAAWIALSATLALGSVQIYDEYGPFAATEADTPCAQGTAIFPFCGPEIPWPHMVAGVVTSTLYYTAATMAFFAMPDPLHIEAQDNAAGARLRAHKALRWFHTIGMLLTTALGTVTANLPPDEVDFGIRQGLALTHMALGGLTWIFLTAAALIMF